MMKKQIMILLVGLVMVILLNGCGSAKKETDPILAVAADINESTADERGTFGANLNWYLQDGILVIRGTGEMSQNDLDKKRWRLQYGKDVQFLVIEDGCTSIQEDAFVSFTNMTGVIIPNSVTVKNAYGAY